MDYIELNCIITAENKQEIAEILIAELSEIDFESFDETDEGIKAYIQTDKFVADKIKNLQINSDTDCVIDYTWQLIKQQNWNAIWEQNFEPICIGDECYVRAPFHKKPNNIKYDIIIEPKMSFGTGHHETTSLMLKTMLSIDFTNKTVLDMGCGTGVLAILASLRNAKSITAIDIDEWAYENTIENCAKNNCDNIDTHKGDAELIKNKKFDIILANINRNILLNDMVHYSLALKENGILLISGIYETDLEVIKEEAQKHHLSIEKYESKNNWVAAKFYKILT
jgi:ribosomal protein L11 methyltransferase